ncbi:MAG: alpha-glucan family phosphorylase [Candidatus Margulisiibacteriota bacterium]
MKNRLVDLTGIEERGGFSADIQASWFGYPIEPIIEAEEKLVSGSSRSVAYFSMEYGLAPSVYHAFKTTRKISPSNFVKEHEVFSNMTQMDYFHRLNVDRMIDLPIYSGGLGVLAGDTLKSAADLALPLVAVGVLWHKGYFSQKFWFKGGGQFPEELTWDPETYPGLVPLKKKVDIALSGQKLVLKLWKYYVYSYDLKNVVPLVLLDANTFENVEYLREYTDQLYRSTNAWTKIVQRMILGAGGMAALEALGYKIGRYHLNEGHAAFAMIEKALKVPEKELSSSFGYTCHTPVEAGHDRFGLQEVEAAMGSERAGLTVRLGSDDKNPGVANLTQLLIRHCDKVNGVSKKHGEVMHIQFPQFKDKIKSITNGIHTFTWMSEPIKKVLANRKAELGDIESDPELLRNVMQLKKDPAFRKELWDAHQENKNRLASLLKAWFFDPKVLTVSWARRFAGYKRPTLIFQDPGELVKIAKEAGGLQIIIAGKAHPADLSASVQIEEMMSKITHLGGQRKSLRVYFLENYDTYFGKLLTSCSDIWLNNPIPPFEASGTSGMKAIVNGVLQLSTLDGWVVEAKDKNIGRIFGYVPKEGQMGSESDLRLEQDSKELYKALGEMAKLYYDTSAGNTSLEDSPWVDMMINCIGEAAFFSTHRMVRQYDAEVWEK